MQLKQSHYCPLVFAAGFNHYTFTLKMASAILAETLDNTQHIQLSG
jgi:hypothetical protein